MRNAEGGERRAGVIAEFPEMIGAGGLRNETAVELGAWSENN